jgi:hypothetical protein
LYVAPEYLSKPPDLSNGICFNLNLAVFLLTKNEN